MTGETSEKSDAEAGVGLYEHYRLVADEGQSPMRMDSFLAGQLPHASRSRVQAAADAGLIRINGKPAKSSYRIKPGDEIVVMMEYPRHELKLTAEEIPLQIIFEDDEIVVINKPPGLVVHPGHGNYSGTLVNALMHHFSGQPGFNSEDPRMGLVHRIDKDTSGLILVAKTEHARLNLSYQFYRKTTHRRYVALVWGDLKQENGTISGNIGRSLSNRQVFTVFADGEHGKPAVTHYRVLERLGYVNLVECRLETGRTHQIRVHMKHIGHPVFNDATYGGDQILRGTTFTKYKQFIHNCFRILPRQALHAKTLGFLHPASGEPMLFDSELPSDMNLVIEKWRNYVSNREIT